MTKRDERSTGANYQVRALARGLDILGAFSLAAPELSITQIAARVNLPKSTVVRLVAILAERGFLERLPGAECYRIGVTAFEVGNIYIQSISLESEARPFLSRLAEETRQSANLGLLDQGQLVHIAIAAPDRPVRYWATIGKREDAHYTGLGKVLLAAMTEAELAQHLDHHELVARTVRSVTDPDSLRAELTRVRLRGYALDDEESNLGIRCIAAPIVDKSGRVVAAVSISGLRAEFVDEVMPHYVAAVQQAGRDISVRLGSAVQRTAITEIERAALRPAGK